MLRDPDPGSPDGDGDPVVALWLDAGAGVSGDMMLGAVVDLGVPVDHIQEVLDSLELGIRLTASEVRRAGVRAVKVDVVGPDDPPQRTLADVLELLSPLDDSVRHAAGEVFGRLADAESSVHGVAREEVSFHEVGAIDSIADVVGTIVALEALGITDVHATVIGLGTGRTSSAHGSLPVPAPAVLMLAKGLPVQAGPAAFESATPTGMALLATVVTSWGPMPDLVPRRVGHGAGTQDPATHPNVLRALLAELGRLESAVVLVEANVDDMDPRLVPGAIDALLEAGARDAWTTPIHMKKGRPALIVSALVDEGSVQAVQSAMFRATTTIGLRRTEVGRVVLNRTVETVEVDGFTVRVKKAWHDDDEANVSVEWDDVAEVARATGRAPKDVLSQATAAARGAS